MWLASLIAQTVAKERKLKKKKQKEKAAGTCVLRCAAHFYKLICLRRWRKNDVAQNILQASCQPRLHTSLPVHPGLVTKTPRSNTDPRGTPRGGSIGADWVLMSPFVFRRSTGPREHFLVSEKIRSVTPARQLLLVFIFLESAWVCVCFREGIAVPLHPHVKPKISRKGDGTVNFETFGGLWSFCEWLI